MKITFGVDSFIWTENFSEKDLWIIKKAEELGFEVIDFAIAHPETFPTERVKDCLLYTSSYNVQVLPFLNTASTSFAYSFMKR